MTAEVDICNLALAYLGDTATVASINPPSGSAQSSHCARFYPMAVRELLEMTPWNFCTRRVQLAYAPSNPSSTWLYCYQAPSDYLAILAILADDATDDYSVGVPWPYTINAANYQSTQLGAYTPQPFQLESNAAGDDIILTNQVDAVARYTIDTTDMSHAPPSFVEALARLLSAKLAGPLLKGEAGRAETKAQMAFFADAYSRAVEADANARRLNVVHTPRWIGGR